LHILQKTRNAMEDYGFLPWWACLMGPFKISWAAKAILALVMARLLGIYAKGKEIKGGFLQMKLTLGSK
jgi:hypothetical protein